MKYVPLLLLAVSQLVLSMVLLYKRHDKISRMFTYFTSLLLLWTFVNVALDYKSVQIAKLGFGAEGLSTINVLNKIGFMLGALILIALYQTVVVSQGGVGAKMSKQVIALGLALSGLAIFPAISGNYYFIGGEFGYHYGLGALLFAPYLLLLGVLATRIGLEKLKSIQTLRERKQTITVLLALFLSAIWGFIFIILIPTLTKNDSFIFIGYLAPYIFTVFMYYAIVWLGLLNFRQIVARSIGYLLSLFALGMFFIIAMQLVARFILRNTIASDEAMLFAAITFVLAMAFQPAKRFFDRVTTKIFYRDAYDTEIVFAKLSRALIGVADIDALIHSVTRLLTKELSVTYAAVYLSGSSGGTHPSYTASEVSSVKRMYDTLSPMLPKGENVLIAELLASSDVPKLTDTLRQKDISAIVRLLSVNKSSNEELGYIVLGPKKSGDMYSMQDHVFLKTVANEISLAIQNVLHYEEIQQFNETLQQRVDDATRKLRMTNEKLRRLDETKDEFISMASHQLRTPLTSVKGYLSMVVDGDVGKLNKQQRELLTQSYLSSQRMVNLISDLLNLSRLSTGKFVIDYAPVDLREVIDEELTQLRDTAEARGVELVYERPETFPTIRLDDNKTHQVVMNFVDNAIYYTPSGGKVTLELVETPTSIEFRVKDNGIGVPRALQRHLFTKFYRAENARRVRPDGTGLGLFMAKKVIIAQGGSIIFESKEGKGSTFGFRFSKKVLADETRKHPVEIQT